MILIILRQGIEISSLQTSSLLKNHEKFTTALIFHPLREKRQKSLLSLPSSSQSAERKKKKKKKNEVKKQPSYLTLPPRALLHSPRRMDINLPQIGCWWIPRANVCYYLALYAASLWLRSHCIDDMTLYEHWGALLSSVTTNTQEGYRTHLHFVIQYYKW